MKAQKAFNTYLLKKTMKEKKNSMSKRGKQMEDIFKSKNVRGRDFVSFNFVTSCAGNRTLRRGTQYLWDKRMSSGEYGRKGNEW